MKNCRIDRLFLSARTMQVPKSMVGPELAVRAQFTAQDSTVGRKESRRVRIQLVFILIVDIALCYGNEKGASGGLGKWA
jgi:hypothetical protein